jgi:hypothetical protein
MPRRFRETLAGRSLRTGRPLDGEPDVGQRHGHVRVNHTERGERVHDRGFLRGVTADPDLRQDADRPLPARGRAAQAQSHCRSGWRGRCGAGFEDPGRCASFALAELVERGCIEVIVTTFSPHSRHVDVTALPARGSRGARPRWRGLTRRHPPNPEACVPRDFNPHVSEGGLGHRSWCCITESVIHHRSKLTRQGPAARIPQAKRGGSTGPPGRSRHVSGGNDEGGEPGPGRGQGRTAAAAARRFIIGKHGGSLPLPASPRAAAAAPANRPR